MARAASLLTEFLGFCIYLHRRGGVLGCGPEALPSDLRARSYGNSKQSNGATPRLWQNSREDLWGGARRGGAGRRGLGLRETLAPDSLGLAESGQASCKACFADSC